MKSFFGKIFCLILIVMVPLIVGCFSFKEIHVTDELNRPVSGAEVYFLDYSTKADDGLIGITDASGKLISPKGVTSSTGMWTIVIRKKGYNEFRVSDTDFRERKDVNYKGKSFFVKLKRDKNDGPSVKSDEKSKD